MSSVTGEGIQDLKDTIAIQAELLELRADRSAQGEAVVIEARLERGMGVVVDALVRWGTLRVGDEVVVGAHHGRVRSLLSPSGERWTEVVPGIPTRILGLSDVPSAGEFVLAVEDEDRAKEVASRRARKQTLLEVREAARVADERTAAEMERRQRVKLREKRLADLERRQQQRARMRRENEDIPTWLEEQPWEAELQAELVREAEEKALAKEKGAAAGGAGAPESGPLNRQRDVSSVPAGVTQVTALVRADTQGSLDAIMGAFEGIPHQDEVLLRVIQKGVGELTERDIEFAKDTNSAILVFNVRVPNAIAKKAERTWTKRSGWWGLGDAG